MAWSLELLKRLNEHGVQYVIIGGVAAIGHGSTRITMGLDICAPLNVENASRIIRALADQRPRWRMRPDLPVITPETPLPSNLMNMYLRSDLGTLDVLGDLPGVGSYDDVAARAVTMNFSGHPCEVVDLDTLLKAKEFAGRDKDQLVIRELRFIQKKLEDRRDETKE